MVVFMINDTDYSANVIADKYVMDNTVITKNYTDMQGRVHKKYVRSKIVGSFEMFFKTLEEYEDFIDEIDGAHSPQSISVTVNYPKVEFKAIQAYLTISPTRTLDASNSPMMRQFAVKVEEY